MKGSFQINSWPATVLLSVAMLCCVAALAILAVLGARSPAALAAVVGSITTAIATLLPHALDRRPKPPAADDSDPYAKIPTSDSPTLPPARPPS